MTEDEEAVERMLQLGPTLKHLGEVRREILAEAQKHPQPEDQVWRTGLISAAAIIAHYQARLVLEQAVGQEGEVVR